MCNTASRTTGGDPAQSGETEGRRERLRRAKVGSWVNDPSLIGKRGCIDNGWERGATEGRRRMAVRASESR